MSSSSSPSSSPDDATAAVTLEEIVDTTPTSANVVGGAADAGADAASSDDSAPSERVVIKSSSLGAAFSNVHYSPMSNSSIGANSHHHNNDGNGAQHAADGGGGGGGGGKAGDADGSSASLAATQRFFRLEWKDVRYEVDDNIAGDAAKKHNAEDKKPVSLDDARGDASSSSSSSSSSCCARLRCGPCGGGGATTVRKEILHGLNGRVESGELLCMLGPSGAGKTTLMDIISGRTDPTTGTVTVNGQRLTRTQWRRAAAYVPQHDVLTASLTVRETVMMHANLRLDRTLMNAAARRERALTVIDALHLRSALDTLVGSDLIKGISGGERKRLAIAIALLTDPAIVFLDEPTSGLDSSTALSLVDTLQSLAVARQTAIVATVHQPSSSLFAKFDKLLLLIAGSTVYHGEARNVLAYFADAGHRCPANSNPADFFLDVCTSYDKTDAEVDTIKRALISRWRAHEHAVLEQQRERARTRAAATSDAQMSSYLSAFSLPGAATGFVEQVPELVRRSYIELVRDPTMGRVKVGETLAQMVILALFFPQLGWNQAALQSRVGFIGFVTMTVLFSRAMSVIMAFPLRRAIFVRERSSDCYSVPAYYVAEMLVQLPVHLVLMALYIGVCYWITGVRDDFERFVQFSLIVIIMGNIGESIGFSLGVAVPTPQAGAAILPALLMLGIMVAGFFSPPDELPVYVAWARYASPSFYAFTAALSVTFEDQPLTCHDNELTASGECPYENGNDFLQVYTATNVNVWLYVVALVGFYAAFRALGLFALFTYDATTQKTATPLQRVWRTLSCYTRRH